VQRTKVLYNITMKRIDVDSPEYKLGQNIARIRISEGLSQENLGEESGISRAYIGRIELGKVSPSLRSLIKISNALGMEITNLFVTENLVGLF
jgi:transcriptional regulator with XRE-family HTH domain